MSFIYLFTALYCEAHMFIKHFRLEKNTESTRFQEFYNETAGIRLTITGTGEIAAAAAAASVCTKYGAGEGDVLLNIGTCAHMSGSAGIFVCNKITEQATGKTFYPDILYRHHFREEALVTGMRLRSRGDAAAASEADLGGTLYDMEAAAIYQAGSYFFGPHQMLFLKVVSDAGAANSVSKEQIAHVLEGCQEPLFDFIGQLSILVRGNRQEETCFLPENEALAEKLCLDMHCSKVMRDSLRQHIRYLTLTGTDYASVIREMYEEGLLPCNDKREGKLCFEELKRRLF